MTPPFSDEPITLAELNRSVRRLESKIDSSVFVSKDIFELVTKSISDRLTKVEETQTWATRLMIGSFVAVIAEAVVIALKIAGG